MQRTLHSLKRESVVRGRVVSGRDVMTSAPSAAAVYASGSTVSWAHGLRHRCFALADTEALDIDVNYRSTGYGISEPFSLYISIRKL